MKKICLVALAMLYYLPICFSYPIITGILYDPAGTDTGYEWVELYNPANESVFLSNFSLERGNGAKEHDWKQVWSGGNASIDAFSFFLVGEDHVNGTDAIVKLILGNAPDAVRLVFGNESVDLVGYGNHSFEEYFLEQPTVDVASGLALVRTYTEDSIFSFANTDDNKQDFEGKVFIPRNSTYMPLHRLTTSQNVTFFVNVSTQSKINSVNILNADVSPQMGHQLVVFDTTLLHIQANVSWAQNLIDVVLRRGDTIINSSHILINGSADGLMAVELPVYSFYLPGNYSVTLSCGNSTKSASFSLQKTMGVSLFTNSIPFAELENGSYVSMITVHNTGNTAINVEISLQNSIFSKLFAKTMVGDFAIINHTLIPIHIQPGLEQSISFEGYTNATRGMYSGSLIVTAVEAGDG